VSILEFETSLARHNMHIIAYLYRVLLNMHTYHCLYVLLNVVVDKRYDYYLFVLLAYSAMLVYHRSPVMLAEFFETLFPGQVHSATICLNLEDLNGLIAPRDIALQKLNKASNVIMATGKDVMVRYIYRQIDNTYIVICVNKHNSTCSQLHMRACSISTRDSSCCYL
jgi:hypothetical protein